MWESNKKLNIKDIDFGNEFVDLWKTKNGCRTSITTPNLCRRRKTAVELGFLLPNSCGKRKTVVELGFLLPNLCGKRKTVVELGVQRPKLC